MGHRAASTPLPAASLDAPEVATQTFEEFFAERRPDLVRALSLHFGNDDLGAEAADDAFLRAYERWATVSRHPNPYGWAYVVGINRGRSLLRRRAVAHRKQPLLAAARDAARDDEPSAAALDTRRAVAKLRNPYRSVVIARFFIGWSVAETAAVLKVSEGTVKSRLSRALRQLRDELGADTGAHEVVVDDPAGDPVTDDLVAGDPMTSDSATGDPVTSDTATGGPVTVDESATRALNRNSSSNFDGNFDSNITADRLGGVKPRELET